MIILLATNIFINILLILKTIFFTKTKEGVKPVATMLLGFPIIICLIILIIL